MESKERILQLVSLYQLTFPGEEPLLSDIIAFLQATAQEGLFDRKNFNGHITASAFVVDEKHASVLMIHHKKLNRWLQPGGHVDGTDASLLAACIRETVEETGLKADHLTNIPVGGHDGIFDIDSHPIPANINKNEPAHTHHDIRYLLECHTSEPFAHNTNEVVDIKWVPLTELLEDVTFGRVAQKILSLNRSPVPDLMDDKTV